MNGNVIFDRLKAALETEYPPLDTSKGDGVIYVGGGKYWPGVVVGCKMLRLIGSKLPIEVWYREGLEKVNPMDVVGLDVTFHPLSDPVLDSKKYGGWAAKLEALYHTKLSKVLYLDADAYCVNDPLTLLENNKTGFKYWQDLDKQKHSIQWNQIWMESPNDVPPVQGGQLFIDRTIVPKLIHLARYMTRNHDLFFRLMYGDQDAWRVALNLRASGYENIGPARYDRVAFICEHEKIPYVVHRVNSKMYHVSDVPYARASYNTFMESFPKEKEAFEFFRMVQDERQTNAAKVFQQIIDNKLWGHGTGGGSYGRESAENVEVINSIIKTKGYKKVVDAGCGDMNIGKRLLAGKYIPIDVVPRPGLTVLDITDVSNLPEGDLLLSKDTVHHWPNKMVHQWLKDLIVSNRYKAILIITDETTEDIRDTTLGGYRPLRLGVYPIDMPGFKRVNSVRQKAYYLYEQDVQDAS